MFLLQSTLIVNGLGAHTEVGTVKKLRKVFWSTQRRNLIDGLQ